MLISRGWEAPLCLIAAGDWAVGDGGDRYGGARQLCAWGADPRPRRLWVTGKSRRQRVRQGLAGAGSQGVARREGVLE